MRRGTNDSQKDREVLHNLQPHTNLRYLTVSSYGGITFPSWFEDGSLSNLETLQLEHCECSLSIAAALGQLPSLLELEIDGLNGVESVGSEFYGGIGTKPAFTSLEVLKFRNMRKWQHWR